jgi:hypothetical protein
VEKLTTIKALASVVSYPLHHACRFSARPSRIRGKETAMLPVLIDVRESGEGCAPATSVDVTVSELRSARKLDSARPGGGTLIVWFDGGSPFHSAGDFNMVRAEIRAALREAEAQCWRPGHSALDDRTTRGAAAPLEAGHQPGEVLGTAGALG